MMNTAPASLSFISQLLSTSSTLPSSRTPSITAMNAIKFTKYGGPELLHYVEDYPIPKPKDDELLIKVHATTVQPVDFHSMRGTPVFIRIEIGIFGPKVPILGCDCAGEVVEVGKEIKEFKVGDEVFGQVASTGYGAFAQYVCSKESMFALKPKYLSWDEAACLPIAGGAALVILRNQMCLQDFNHLEGMQKRILIIGASGGVGSMAVQIAKQCGALVTGVCSTKNVEMIKALGADEVIDYKKEDWAKNGEQYDFILDNIVDHTTTDFVNSLAPGGLYVFNSDNMGILFKIAFHPNRGNGRKLALAMSRAPTREELLELARMSEEVKLKILIHKRYPLSAVPEAMELCETGHAPAKLVINPQIEAGAE